MLTETQTVTLAAALNCIIPSDEYPGAWDAGVGDFLFQQFGQNFYEIVSAYRVGLDALETEARQTHGEPFAHLDAGLQEAVLARVETGETVTEWPLNPRRFFALMVQHAMEGYYADPGNGGNRGGVSWTMIGFQVAG